MPDHLAAAGALRVEHRQASLEELGRPRIDVIATLSGVFRDLLPLQTRMLAEAALLAASADEPLDMNFVRAHAIAHQNEHACDFETAALDTWIGQVAGLDDLRLRADLAGKPCPQCGETVKTGDEKRDVEMIKWLGGGKPKGEFKFEKSWDETPEGGSAQGAVTINGVSKTYGFRYTVKQEGGWVTIDGSVPMDYQNFKLPLIRSMAVMTVDPKLSIRFHLVGKLK